MSNRLANETSPYLLQHKDNPVDWFPWGEEALQRAKSLNKPILLSIGYSACHWCHVMEHESFENPQIAKLMNDRFICIKVDREERPDLDQIYQNVAQALTQSGGWPLTVFLTSDLKPYFGGTYFPPDDRYGRPGFARVLVALSDAYQNDRESVDHNAVQLTEYIQSLENPTLKGQTQINLNTLESAARELLSHIDWENGGMGGAPKFPSPMGLSFLWRFGMATENAKAKDAVLLTLRKMAQGGIYDQIGGGFHRYSVDATWSVPHFEKMLYDNALLLKLYSEVLLTSSGNPSLSPLQGLPVLEDSDRVLFLSIIESTVEYVLREMTSPEGGFYSAQDADSEGEEGKFFVWDLNDFSEVLTSDEAKVSALYYGVTENGNFEHGKTVLYRSQLIERVAQQGGWTAQQAQKILQSARIKLFQKRSQRVAPGLDDKVLTSWNGLMISGLIWAAQALKANGKSEQGEQAQKAAFRAYQFICQNLIHQRNPESSQKEGSSEYRLMSTYQRGKAKHQGYLDDYAFMAMAALDLSRFAQSSEVKDLLSQSRDWLQIICNHFKAAPSDGQSLGYYFTSDDHEKLIQRPKNFFDQAIPSGTAVGLTSMLVLAEMEEEGVRELFQQEVDSQISSLFHLAVRSPHGLGETLSLSLLYFARPIFVSGDKANQVSHYPHVFQKAPDVLLGQTILVCHQNTCGIPHQNLERAREEVISKFSLK